MSTVLQVKNLNKQFGTQKAVNNLSFEVKAGQLFAFLGQNGAGKSTTINMIIGALEKDNGEIIYGENENYQAFKNKIGVVFQNNIFDDQLTVCENLKLYGQLYSNSKDNIKARYEELAQLFGFKEYEKKLFKTLSGGQKRKVEIARALFNTPKILFLDEPTTGLDPRTRIEVWNIINAIRKQTDMTVFLTTHYMEETTDADEVVIIHNGIKVATGSPIQLKEKFSTDKLRIVPNDAPAFLKALKQLKISATQIADHYEIQTKDAQAEIELLNKLKSHIKTFELVRGSMDDVFLNAVGQKLEVL